jgi:hypothetical protein
VEEGRDLQNSGGIEGVDPGEGCDTVGFVLAVAKTAGVVLLVFKAVGIGVVRDLEVVLAKLRDETELVFWSAVTGTGVAYTGLVLFDLTIFLSTRLPILVHDTVVFKNIENDSVSRLLPVYLRTSKQSFVALDEIDKYGPETSALLMKHQVLVLDAKRLLYIKDWRSSRS